MSFIARKNRVGTIKKLPKEVAAEAAGWGILKLPYVIYGDRLSPLTLRKVK
jgi:hypothetical protein